MVNKVNSLDSHPHPVLWWICASCSHTITGSALYSLLAISTLYHFLWQLRINEHFPEALASFGEGWGGILAFITVGSQVLLSEWSWVLFTLALEYLLLYTWRGTRGQPSVKLLQNSTCSAEIVSQWDKIVSQCDAMPSYFPLIHKQYSPFAVSFNSLLLWVSTPFAVSFNSMDVSSYVEVWGSILLLNSIYSDHPPLLTVWGGFSSLLLAAKVALVSKWSRLPGALKVWSNG